MKQLEIRNLSVEYLADGSVVKAINNMNLVMEKGTTLGLVGETGAGKTTTALSIMGLLPEPPAKITSGEIWFDGENLLEKNASEMRKIRGNRIAMIFQDPMTALNPVLRVGDQIAEVVALHNKCSRAEAVQRSVEMLEMVGIPAERGADYPHQFSGGMKQRVVIAIALVCNPELLIADEPTTALDVTIQAQVLSMMNELKQQLGTSVMLVTHDLGVVAETCDSVAVIYAGEVVEYGNLQHIFNETMHPYTKGLFGSLPSLEYKERRLTPIVGQMPNPTDLPKGCKFNPRCPNCIEKCRLREPPVVEMADGHLVRCHLVRKDERVGEESVAQ